MLQEILKKLGGNQQSTPRPMNEGYVDPFKDMNALQKIGIGIGGVDAVNSVRDRALEQYEKQAMGDIMRKVQSGEMPREDAQIEYSRITGDYGSTFGVGARAPAAIQEWEKFQQMSPEQKREYLQMKRANQMFDRGGSQVVLDPQGEVVTEIDKTLAPEQLPQTKEAQAAATTRGTAQGEKQVAVGKLTEQADLMLKTIDDIIGDEEGLEASTGGLFGARGRASAATGGITEAQRRFQPKIDQLKGQTFLDAYERLKGGGVITEVEGTKATQALARLSQAQNAEDFRKALEDVRDVVKVGLSRAKAEGVDPLEANRNAVENRQSEIGTNTYQREDLKKLSNEELLEMLGAR